MSYAPDRETSSDDEDIEMEEECVLCSEYRHENTGYVLYPCECLYGITRAHQSCFQDYCNSWPLNHENRTICPFCKVPYRGIIGLVERDESYQRMDVYIVSTYMIIHSVTYSVLCWATIPHHMVFVVGIHALYTTLMYFIFDLLLSTVGVSRLNKKMKIDSCTHALAIAIIFGLVLFRQQLVLLLCSILVHGAMIRRLAWRRMEFHHTA